MKLDSGENICKADITIADQRTILFTSDEALRVMARAKSLSVDGTFRMCPKLWGQLLVICAEVTQNSFVPVAFVLMPKRKTANYDIVFQSIKDRLDDLGLTLAAESIMCDFEKAMRRAIKNAFEDILLRGCHFHFSQCVWRFVSSVEKMSIPYKEVKEVGYLVRAAIALAFVPNERRDEALDVLRELQSKLPKQYAKFGKNFMSYILSTWINGK